MRDTRLSILVVLVGLFAISVPVFAHHGNASYDYAKTITVKGTVTQWVWLNPHCLLKFDVKNDKGEFEHWVTEASELSWKRSRLDATTTLIGTLLRRSSQRT